jgi:hypothetical protein
VLQQAICETSRGSAYIGDDQASDRDSKRSERRLKFEAPATYIGEPPVDGDPCVGQNARAWLVHVLLVNGDLPSHDQALGFGSTIGQALLYKQEIEALPGNALVGHRDPLHAVHVLGQSASLRGTSIT